MAVKKRLLKLEERNCVLSDFMINTNFVGSKDMKYDGSLIYCLPSCSAKTKVFPVIVLEFAHINIFFYIFQRSGMSIFNLLYIMETNPFWMSHTTGQVCFGYRNLLPT